ncbi:hypothetical protein CXG81DRAFT_19639 [Caulochytrium protostelioides]|uniref:Uncharacterized protein n=1 Tax=Caulochytrium protostelioides TaxID=1555241 RepID=A0A4P9X5X2_9FUNG|nr:hypothetical protein CXG81DRAFT_19639 [Caulochytrium protostelioides]|eukprot:RKP00391.1 hypothetical protein CXG81DRAFT_19639 [Caulochytrium protostelioides]
MSTAPSSPSPTARRLALTKRRCDEALAQLDRAVPVPSSAAPSAAAPSAAAPSPLSARTAPSAEDAASTGAASSFEISDRLLRQRLQTFSPLFWFDKPPALAPPVAARHGWQCIGTDALQCSVCRKRLVVALDGPAASPPPAGACVLDDDALEADLADRARAALAAQFARQLATAHADTCPWRSTHLPAQSYAWPWRLSRAAQVDAYRARALRLRRDPRRADGLAQRWRARRLGPRLPRATVAQLVAIIRSPSAAPESDAVAQLAGTALAALCGWQGGPDVGQLECRLCLRRLMLSPLATATATTTSDRPTGRCDNGEADNDTDTDVEGDEDGPGVQDNEDGKDVLDLVDAHRWFCPWIVVASSIPGPGPAAAPSTPDDHVGAVPGALVGTTGWQTLGRMLLEGARPEKRLPPDTTESDHKATQMQRYRAIKQLLDFHR